MTDTPNVPVRPQGLAFLELGERLRQRGQYEAAATVALAGLAHYPALAEAHDLLGRIRADQGQDAAAIAAWHAALECEAGHVGALKGLAFVAFRTHDFATAERYLETAVRGAPHDVTLLAALDRVRAAHPIPVPEPAGRVTDPDQGVLLLDAQGMRLSGGVGPGSTSQLADAVAAEAAGLGREAARVCRLLDLGTLQVVTVEGSEQRLALQPVSADASVLVCRPAATPVGRLLASTTRAADAARTWLERLT